MASNDSDEQVVHYKITDKKYVNFIVKIITFRFV